MSFLTIFLYIKNYSVGRISAAYSCGLSGGGLPHSQQKLCQAEDGDFTLMCMIFYTGGGTNASSVNACGRRRRRWRQ